MFYSNSRRLRIKQFAVILAGGRGERFWPKSQPDTPKQLLSVFNNEPLLSQTISRINQHFSKRERVLVIPKNLKKITTRFVGREQTIIEPMRRNTAAAICLAAGTLKSTHGDGIIHVMPADHLIKPRDRFIATLKYSSQLAEQGNMITYGIKPDRPETGYGYIKIGPRISSRGKIVAYQGISFTEKPSRQRARYYQKTKKYLWNSGIFTFRISSILDQIKKYIPRTYQGVMDYLRTKKVRSFAKIPDISIDYGVMEKSKNFIVIKGTFQWDDVGSWLALERYFKRDNNGNIRVGDIKGLEIHRSIMYTNGIPLRVFGIEDLVIVVSKNGVLVCHKDKAPEIKKLFRK
jgi:mannose-1-phosphate guanylyltransferase